MDHSIKLSKLFACFGITLSLWFIPAVVFTQQLSEEDLKQQADALFKSEEYGEAVSLYSQLLSNFPDNSEYSFKLGASKLFSEKDKEAPIVYLERALKKGNTDPNLYYYLAKAYHINYRFTDAIKFYEKYQETGKKRSKIPVSREIEMCKNGQTLLKNIKDIAVKDKKQINLEDFYKAYNNGSFNGKLLEAPEIFLSKLDKEKNHKPVIFTNPSYKKIFFSSYGDKGENGKDIYYVEAQEDGEFSKPIRLSETINTPYDEDYAFLHPNGKRLYFASKGHNSMGGYDIFLSEYDEGIGKWTSPQNVDFAINSPGDDFLYVTDESEENATFASTRESVWNKTHVYTVQTTRIPVNSTVLKGTFASQFAKKAQITVKNASSGEEVGTFYPDTSTGEYTIVVPNGGQYEFLVDAEGSEAIHKGIVSVPRQQKLVSLGQEIDLDMVGNEETLQIINKFDEKNQIEDEELKAALFKQKQKLEVNYDQVIDQIDQMLTEDTVQEEAISYLDTPEGEEVLEWAKQEKESKDKMIEDLQAKSEIDIADEALEAEIKNKLTEEIGVLTTQSNQLENLITNFEANPTDSSNYNALVKTQVENQTNQLSSNYNNLFHNDLNKLNDNFKTKNDELETVRSSISNLEDDMKQLGKQIEEAKKKEKPALETQKTELEKEITGQKTEEQKLVEELNTIRESIEEVKIKQEQAHAVLNGQPLVNDIDDTTEETFTNPPDTSSQNSTVTDNTEENIATSEETDSNDTNNETVKTATNPQDTSFQNPPITDNIEENIVTSEKTDANDTNNETAKTATNPQDTSSQNPPITDNTEENIATNENITSNENTNKTIENNWEENVPDVGYNDFYDDLLTDLDTAKDYSQEEKNKELTKIYDHWLDQIKDDMVSKTNQVNNLPDNNVEKEQLLIELEQLSKLREEKEDLRNQILQPDQLASSDIAETSSNELESDKLTNVSSAKTMENVDDAINSFDTKEYIVEEIITESNPEISESLNTYSTNKSAAKTIDNEYNKVQYLKEINDKEIRYINQLIDNIDQKTENTEMTVEEKNDQFKLRDNLTQLMALKENKGNTYAKYLDENSSLQEENTISGLPTAMTETNTNTQDNITYQQEPILETDDDEVAYKPEEDPALNFTDAETIETTQNNLTERRETLSDSINASDNSLKDINGQLASASKAKTKMELLDQKKEVLVNTRKQQGEIDGLAVVSNELGKLNDAQDLNYFDNASSQQMVENLITEIKGERQVLETEVKDLNDQLANTKKKDEQVKIKEDIVNKEAQIKYLTAKAEAIDQNKDVIKDQQAKTTAQILLNNSISTIDVPLSNKQLTDAEIEEIKTNPNYQEFLSNEKLYKDASVAYIGNQKRHTKMSNEKSKLEARLAEIESQIENQDQDANEKIKMVKEADIINQRLKKLNKSIDSLDNVNSELLTITQSSVDQNAELLSRDVGFAQNLFALKQNHPEESLATNEKVIEANNMDQEPDSTEIDPLALVEMENPFESENTDQEPTETTTSNTQTEETSIPQAQDNTETVSTSKNTTSDQENNNTSPPIAANTPQNQVGSFAITDPNASVYNDQNPIPINPPMPSGVLYKVQIGAFRNPIPQNTFKGFNPIMGQTTANGLTRYLAGNFTDRSSAEEAKLAIQSLGYSDAFVVVYQDGQRTTFNNVSEGRLASTSGQDNLNTSATDVNAIPGTIYTVQVGAYRTPPSTGPLMSIRPLNVEKLNNGINRYTTGQFTSFEQASASKDLMIDLGVKDAFVTAYRNGQRITLQEAKNELNDNSVASTSTTSNQNNIVEGEIGYSVQVGAYSDFIPVTEVDEYIQLNAKYPVLVHKNSTGLYIYTTGYYANRSDAEALELEIKNNFPSLNAYVVETRDGIKVE